MIGSNTATVRSLQPYIDTAFQLRMYRAFGVAVADASSVGHESDTVTIPGAPD